MKQQQLENQKELLENVKYAAEFKRKAHSKKIEVNLPESGIKTERWKIGGTAKNYGDSVQGDSTSNAWMFQKGR